MATKGTRNTGIAFGGFEISVALSKCQTSRDLKTEVVDEAGTKVSMGGGGGGRRSLPEGTARAVRLSENDVVRLPQDELEAIEEKSKNDYGQMQVIETIDYRQVPTERICGSYWLQPANGAAKTLRLLAEGLRRSEKVAIVKWVSTSREKLGVIRVRGGEGKRALLLSELVFANDFLAADQDALEINNVEVDERSVGVAVNLIESFARGAGDPHMVDEASDEAVDARLALFERLAEEHVTTALEESVAAADDDNSEDGATVIDLEAARAAA